MTIVNDILQRMPGVGQPQRRFLARLFSTIVALRGRVNFRHLSRYCAYSERPIARQFRRAFAWPTLHQHVIQTARAPEAAVSAAQDASCIPKSGKQTFGLGHFFNGCTSRPERGLEIATLAVVDVTRRGAFSLAIAQTPPGEGRAPDAQEETRMDFSLQQLRAHRQRLPPQVTYHCVDGALAKQQYLVEVVRLKLPPMTKVRCEANCRCLSTGPHPQRRGARRQYDGKVNWQDLHRVVSWGPLAAADHGQLYTTVVWHVTLKQPLRVVGLVNRKDPAKQRSIVLAATDRALEGHTLVTLYGARFQSEFLFRDRKQFTGLRACQARAEAALDFHCNAALATLHLARAEAWQPPPATTHQAFSMASGKQRRFHERLLDVCIEK